MNDPQTAPAVPALNVLDAANTPNVAFRLTRGDLSDNGATPWTASLGLGTPPQPLRFMLDTGTTNTWITDACCASEACQCHAAFDPQKSHTFRPDCRAPESVSFGPWGSMGVVLGNDVCHLEHRDGGQRRLRPLDEAMSLYLAVSYSGPQFAELDCDGGLAIPSIPCEQPSALLPQLKRQGLIDYAIASFWGDAERGEGACLMGAVDSARFDPASLNVMPLRPLGGSLDYLWSVPLDGIACAGQTIGAGISFVLDTGSSRFKGGPNTTAALCNAVTDNGARPSVVSDAAALADYPDMLITLGGVAYPLTPQDYFMQLPDGRWELGIHHLEGLPDDLLVVGSVFLDTVYSIFYYETGVVGERAVGLATPCFPRLSVSGVWENEFGSTLEIGPLAADGTFSGRYGSHTGASGVYPVVGVADPQPEGDSVAVSFAVSWRSLEGEPDPSWHWVSGFTGLLQLTAGVEVMKTTYLLQQNATAAVPEWMATAVYPSTFRRKGE